TDGFILKFDTLCNRQWATRFGGNGNDCLTSIFVDETGIYTTGYGDSTTSSPIPLQNFGSAYYQTNYNGTEAFVNAYTPGGALEWSTYFGGTGNDYATCILRDSCGIFICGKTTAGVLPVQTQG